MIPTYGTGTFTVHCPKKLLPAVSHWNDTASGSVDALASYRDTLYTHSVTQPFSCTLCYPQDTGLNEPLSSRDS